jgi:hypothetical protein
MKLSRRQFIWQRALRFRPSHVARAQTYPGSASALGRRLCPGAANDILSA